MANEKSYYKINARTEGIKPNVLRKSGIVPGVIYGGTLEGAHPIQIERSELIRMLRDNTKSSVIDVDFDGDKGAVIVREVMKDAVSGEVMHLDLQAIRRDEVLTLDVMLHILGEEELASRRLIVNQNMDMIMVKGPANQIPDSVTIDLTGKGPDDRVLVGEIKLADGLELITDPDEMLVTISESKTSQSLEDEEDATEADVEVPVVDEKSSTEE